MPCQSVTRRDHNSSANGITRRSTSAGNKNVSSGSRELLPILIRSEPEHHRTSLHTVEILKQPGQTLGVYISEGNGRHRDEGIFISRIPDGSLVGNDDLLHVGDEILRVNGVNVTGMTLDDVVVLMSIPRVLVLRLKTPQVNVRLSPDRYGDALKVTDATASESVSPARMAPLGDSKQDTAERIQNKFEELYHEKHVRCDNFQEYRDDIECIRTPHETEENASLTDSTQTTPSHCQRESRLTHDVLTRQQEMPGGKPERRTSTSPGGVGFNTDIHVRKQQVLHANAEGLSN